MKLLLVGYLHSEGGVRNSTLWLARGMAARGHQVTVATPSPIGSEPWDLPREDTVRIVNIGSIRQILFGYPGGGHTAFDCVVVIGTGWKSMIGPLLNRRIRKRVYFEVMGGQRNGILDPRILVHCGFDAIVGQGRPVEAEFCRNLGWSGRSITIPAMPHPLELVADLTRSAPPRPKRSLLKACYFSRLLPDKGAHWLLEQWDQLAEHVGSLDIWGTGPDEQRIRNTIADKGLQDRVRLYGSYRGDASYIAQLQSYDVELLPTFGSEGAPLVLLEAMACGLPFVANGVGGISDYTNLDCRITSGNLDEFLPALSSIAEALYAGEIQHGRLQRFYIDHFSVDALCHRWELFLQEIVAA